MRILAILLPLAALSAADVPSLIGNGSFEEVDGQGKPAAWSLGAGATIESRDGSRVLALKAEAGNASAQQALDLDPAWGVLRFSYRVKVDAIRPGTEGWHNARIALTFHGTGGGVTHLVAGDWKEPTAGWVQVRQLITIPTGAVKVNVSPAIFNASGSWAIDDLRVEVAARRGEGIDADLPAGQSVTWGREPVEVQGPHRGTVCLNGLWRFQPAAGPASAAAQATGWGWLRVPGSWRDGPLPRPAKATGPAWEGFNGESPAAWYERDLAIPAAWSGRRIVLDLRRVSTDAKVLIDGREVGGVAWPGGEVDLSAAVEPGRTHQLRIKVVAVADQAEVVRFMGMGEGQLLKEKVVLATRGLIGDVLLTSRPAGANLTGCAIRTTVKPAAADGPVAIDGPAQPVQGDTLAVTAEYAGLPAAASLALVATVRDASGAEVRRFTASAAAAPGTGSVSAAWPWPDPRLWDIGKPNLYTLELAVRGPGLDDALTETFGFREFRIDGKRFILNGTEIRLRPAPVHAEQSMGGVRELAGDALDGLRWAGFNTEELWPWDRDERGSWEFDDLWCAEADKRGFLMIAPALWMTHLVGTWDKPGVADGWNARMAPGLKRLRNHPSVVMWVTGTNRFGHGLDQNPLAIGNHDRAWLPDKGWQRDAGRGLDALRRIKELDPSRPVMTHAGGAVGEVYTANCYLCLTPLQEREEWPSAWAKDGDMPVLMVEFGTPLYVTMHRGRRGYGHASTSEPLYTEYAAIYQGAEAYRLESPEYRSTIASTYDKDQLWNTWHSIEIARIHEGFNRLQALFQTNTWRTWRTWGVTGGILPWCNGHGWLRDETGGAGKPAVAPLAPFEPGLRGTWRGEATRALISYFRPEGMPLTAAGRALVAANQDTLAWIGGAPDFTDKTHHVRAGATLDKIAVVINDGRTEAAWNLTWTAELGGVQVAAGALNGRVGPACTVQSPISVRIPETLAADRVQGVLRMVCRIGGASHADAFPFTAFEPATAVPAKLALIDPVGDTTGMLRALGIAAPSWDGAPTNRLVVVGRNAFARGGADPSQLVRHLAAGGRVLLMGQDPAWLQERLGLRVARQLSRRAYPVIADHPALGGLDADCFRDWAGSSRLVPAIDAPLSDARMPSHGWRWGARHVVSSAAIEIPHRAGWRPILACEFDGAYTPLAELSVAGGSIMVCTLDLEDHAEADPAAERAARAILAAAAAARPEPRSAAAYLGGDAGAGVLETSGIRFARSATLPERGTVVIGPDAGVDDAELDAFLRRGGRALILPRAAAAAPLGLTLARTDKHPGSLSVPAWPSCRGIWPGELHRRSDGPAWTVSGGGDAVGADGLLAEVRRGGGVAVFCQLDAGLLDADRLAYNRLTRWRWTRVLAQLAANLGIACSGDERLLNPIAPPDRVSLAGTWKAVLTAPLPAIGEKDPKPKDAGPSARALALVAVDADESGMQEVQVSKEWESYGGPWLNADGEAVFRRTFEIPPRWAGHDLTLSLGAVDDFDTAYVDGIAVGTTTITTPSFWTHQRHYTIPARLATPGRHVVAVRVFDHFGGGGMVGSPEQLVVEPKVPLSAPPASLYHPDYRADFPLGDDPYRYYRW